MRSRLFVSALLAVGLIGCNGVCKLDLLASGRARWQRTDEVVARLELRPGDRVADIGAGEGYFLPFLSEAVGADGRVFAVEVDEQLAGALQARFAQDGANIEVVLGEFTDPKLSDASVDVILIVNTYHHIEDRPDYFRNLRSDLREGARVAIIEPDEELGGVLSLLLDEGHTSVAADVEREMAEAGYVLQARHEFLPVQIFLVFTPGGATTTPGSAAQVQSSARSASASRW
jgi:ubiquinone/menaquinone biosynthesis C-methylase UbiE